MDWKRLQKIPILREGYDNCALVQFISLSMWKNIAGTIGNAESDMYVRVLTDRELSLEDANVLSNTLGFVQLRKREFVQYMSIGMTEANIRKMFSTEALVIAGRPLLITLPLTIVFVGLASLSSFSNQDEGGVIIFGIDEEQDFKEVGVYDTQDIQKKINEQCLQMEPIVRPLLTVTE